MKKLSGNFLQLKGKQITARLRGILKSYTMMHTHTDVSSAYSLLAWKWWKTKIINSKYVAQNINFPWYLCGGEFLMIQYS